MPDKPHIRPKLIQQKASNRGRAQKTPTYDELGTTGLRHYGGFVAEEWLTRLSGKRGAWVYREMADNDAIIGAMLFAIEMLARGVPWEVEPGEDEAAAQLIEECKDDMSGTWPDFIAEVFSMLTYGWEFSEIVYKRRMGPDPKGTGPDGEPLPSSRYDDGKIGWRKLPTRAQETLEQWEFAEDGGLNAMVQVAYDGQRRTIPMEKALLFRTTTKRNNPEGRSILRNAFVAWFQKKNIEETEAIGVDRDLAGIPVIEPPEGFDITDPNQADIVAAAQEVVTGIRRDEDEGVLLPAGWTLTLLSTAGSRQMDTDKIIRRKEQRIATTILADFILMAQDSVGSFALGTAKIDTFGQAMQAWLMSIAEVLNRYAIPRLLRLNGLKVTDPPKLMPGKVGQQDIEKISQFLGALHLAGAPVNWDQVLMAHLFELAGLPEPEESPVDATAAGDDALGNVYDDGTGDPPPPAGGAADPTADELAAADGKPGPGDPKPKPTPKLKPKPKAG